MNEMNESMTPQTDKKVSPEFFQDLNRGVPAFKMVATHISPCLVLMGKFMCLPDHPKGDRSWVFAGRTDVEAETPILWPSDAKN